MDCRPGPGISASPVPLSGISLRIAWRDRPFARCSSDTPPQPWLIASFAALRRRVRSSRCGQIERSLRFNSESAASMPKRCSTRAHHLIPSFIYAP